MLKKEEREDMNKRITDVGSKRERYFDIVRENKREREGGEKIVKNNGKWEIGRDIVQSKI